MIVRPYRPADREALYDICLRTGDDGADASGQYADPSLIGDVWLGAYLAFEPDLARVLDDGAPAGYLVATGDTAAFEARCERDWWPSLRERVAGRRVEPGSRDAEQIARIGAPPVTPGAIAEAFPAHFHIDLLPRAQGLGLGRRLIEILCEELARRDVRGLHLGVSPTNTNAIGFYRHLGFVPVGEDPCLFARRLRRRQST